MKAMPVMDVQHIDEPGSPVRGGASRRGRMLGLARKIVSAADAVRLIHAGDTVAMGGLVGIGVAEEITLAIEERFLKARTAIDDAGSLKDLTLVFAAAQGDGRDRGLNHLAHLGLVRRAIGGHWALAPKLAKLALDNLIEAYNLPLGVITHLYRDGAAGKPGLLSRIGLDTFVDPRFGGGKINERTVEDLVSRMKIGDEEFLFYKSIPIDVAIVRGTTADEAGNVTMEKEALTLESLSIAMAAHNAGGIVIVQVERIAERGALNPREVKIPGILVDCVVVASPEHHMQTFETAYSAAFAGEMRVPEHDEPLTALGVRKVVARRAAMELQAHSVVNLGIGLPELVGTVASEEGVARLITLTEDPGVIGGVPAAGLSYGAAINAQAIIDQPYQFDFYDGGGLDIAILGMAEVDAEGNVNVSRFGDHLAGAGGFINISQSAGKVVFAGTFTSGPAAIDVRGGKLVIEHDGDARKFVSRVEQRTFSGRHAAANGREVLFVTERCVFRLDKEGLELTEIAPGVDMHRDILDRMPFSPKVVAPILMDSRLFRSGPIGLRVELEEPVEGDAS